MLPYGGSALGHTSLSLLLILVTSVLGLRTVLSADPNLPLATAAENMSHLLRDAHPGPNHSLPICTLPGPKYSQNH